MFAPDSHVRPINKYIPDLICIGSPPKVHEILTFLVLFVLAVLLNTKTYLPGIICIDSPIKYQDLPPWHYLY